MSYNEQISQILDVQVDKKAENPYRAYSTLVGGTLYMIVSARRLNNLYFQVLGSQYILGNISPYIQSYYHVEAKET